MQVLVNLECGARNRLGGRIDGLFRLVQAFVKVGCFYSSEAESSGHGGLGDCGTMVSKVVGGTQFSRTWLRDSGPGCPPFTF